MNRYQRNIRRSHTKFNGLTTTLFYYILPFFVVNGLIFYLVASKPKLEVNIGDTNDYRATTATITVKSWLPTKNMTVALDTEEVKLSKAGGRVYSAIIEKNGVLEVYAENFNGMSSTVFGHVNVLDDNPPTLDDAVLMDGILTVTFGDSQSGIDYGTIFAVDSKGERILPLTMDKSLASVTFSMDSEGLAVHASDLSGNEMQTTFRSHMEDGKEVLDTEESEFSGADADAGGEDETSNIAGEAEAKDDK